MEKQKTMLWLALSFLAIFIFIRSINFNKAFHQNKIIVYNVPKHQAIDVIRGRSYYFIGDSDLLEENFFRNFHLQPSRILHRMSLQQYVHGKDFDFGNSHIVIIDTTINFLPQQNRFKVHTLILSKNPRLYISNLFQSFSIDQIVIDGSVPPWKAKLWKRDCDSLHIPCHDVSEKGAFEMNL